MKKFIIIAAILLTSGVAALSFTRDTKKEVAQKIKIERTHFSTRDFSSPKSDISSAD
ncbi:hypothetical protein [Mucilaginibacter gynuensis]|uniref:hypothetical protein n=1 Tax=Mucilaginibacter gynuensis TaxID=1302236 RepID=UPI0031E6553C